MFSASIWSRTVGVVALVLFVLGLGPVADAVAADDPQQLEAEQAKLLAALKAALPANDTNLQRLVEVQARLAQRRMDQFAQRVRDENVAIQLLLQKDKLDLEAKLRDLTKEPEVKKLDEKVPQVDLLAYDRPRGKILSVEKDQRIVEVNLGSADFLRPGLTFSVFGDAEYKPSAERKAALVVHEITGEHRCRARVTELKNAVRHPLAAGDLLYNPAWAPGLRERVAIIGRVDLQGDGADHTAAFVRALEKAGVIVDAWTDLSDASVKGTRKAISRQTNFLIVGEGPELDEERTAKIGAGELEKRLTVNRQMTELHEQAVHGGVSIVNARRFLALIGMPVPRLADGPR